MNEMIIDVITAGDNRRLHLLLSQGWTVKWRGLWVVQLERLTTDERV